MPKLKCIGGSHDGEWIYVDQNANRLGDIIRVVQHQELMPLTSDFNINSIPDKITVQYNMYKLEVFNFSKEDKHFFLVPYNWTAKDAIIFQFNK